RRHVELAPVAPKVDQSVEHRTVRSDRRTDVAAVVRGQLAGAEGARPGRQVADAGEPPQRPTGPARREAATLKPTISSEKKKPWASPSGSSSSSRTARW